MLKNVNNSYWEFKQFFDKQDLIIIGSGIVGLSSALSYKKKNKNANVLILDRGWLPSGASTKNAGFACFGSPSELLDDLSKMEEQIVWETVEMRWKGLNLLTKRLGEKNLRMEWNGGYEIFDDKNEFDLCRNNITFLNDHIQKQIGLKNTFSLSSGQMKRFKNAIGVIQNKYEGQIDTGLMMHNLTKLAVTNDIKILNSVSIDQFIEVNGGVEIITNCGIFKASSVIVAVNGFARELLGMKEVFPARAQVLITKPIKGLKLKGCFHYQKGFYYFRNIDDRILFGGGRNLDIKGETTTKMELNPLIQKELDKLLKGMILPDTKFDVDQRWTGIMGVGSEKKPIIEFKGKNILCAVRMGGMGVAIGSMVGEIAAKKISQN